MDKVITKFNEITTKHERTTFYTPNQCAFTIRNKGENKHGVPKYWLHMSEKNMNLIQKSKHTGRVLTHKQIGVQYLTFTSCNLSNTVQGIFESAGIKTELE